MTPPPLCDFPLALRRETDGCGMLDLAFAYDPDRVAGGAGAGRAIRGGSCPRRLSTRTL